MRIFIISIGIFLFFNELYATPIITSLESDESSSSEEENGVVYVFNMYAVRNTNSKAVAKILSQTSLDKLPSTFEPLGMVVTLDNESDDAYTLDEISELFEDTEMTLTKIDFGNHLNIYELTINLEDDDTMPFDDFLKLIENEDLTFYMSIEENKIKVTFEEELRSPQDQSLTLKEFLDYLKKEELKIDTVRIQVESYVVGFSIEISETESSEKSKEHDKEISTTQRIDDEIINTENKDVKINEIGSKEEKKIEKNFEDKIEKNFLVDKKKEKNEKNDDRFVTLDYVTRADSINKIRRRRSVCPECKFGNLIKELAHQYEKHN